MKKKIIFTAIFFIVIFFGYAENQNKINIGDNYEKIKKYLCTTYDIELPNTTEKEFYNMHHFNVNGKIDFRECSVIVIEIFECDNEIIGYAYTVKTSKDQKQDRYKSIILDICTEENIYVEDISKYKYGDYFFELANYTGMSKRNGYSYSFDIVNFDIIGTTLNIFVFDDN